MLMDGVDIQMLFRNNNKIILYYILKKGTEYIFDSDFIAFLKEENKEKTYFALRVDNTDVLVDANK